MCNVSKKLSDTLYYFETDLTKFNPNRKPSNPKVWTIPREEKRDIFNSSSSNKFPDSIKPAFVCITISYKVGKNRKTKNFLAFENKNGILHLD